MSANRPTAVTYYRSEAESVERFDSMMRALIMLIFHALALAVFSDACADLQEPIGNNVFYNSTSVAVGTLKIASTAYNNTATLCRIIGVMKYGEFNNNTLNFEVWLPPEASYNSRYLSVGNGGFAGSIDYSSMLKNVNNGYAVGGCDSGHSESDNGASTPESYVPYLNNHDETLAWIHNSIAMFTEPAKALTSIFYGKEPQYLYCSGCSTGGAQGFALAQYHPEIFDGIYSGSPGNHYSHLILSFLWNGLNSNATESTLSPNTLDLITDSVLGACDSFDGVEDGVLEDPTQCHFDIFSLLCSDGQNPTADNKTVCLALSQIQTAQKFYAGPIDVRSQTQVYPGFAFGSERQWSLQEDSLYLDYAVPILQNLVFDNISYDYTTFNWASDIDLVNQKALPLIDEIAPDLSAFQQRGGKMIVTQGWADPFNVPYWPIQQRNEMHQIFGTELSNFYTLFMIPGGGHCGAAAYGYESVPATYEVLDRLVPWVEQGSKPQDLLTTSPPDGSNITKTLYPYL
ncbi:putative Tannase and feruloyl esterase [Seiridium cardinale]